MASSSLVEVRLVVLWAEVVGVGAEVLDVLLELGVVHGGLDGLGNDLDVLLRGAFGGEEAAVDRELIVHALLGHSGQVRQVLVALLGDDAQGHEVAVFDVALGGGVVAGHAVDLPGDEPGVLRAGAVVVDIVEDAGVQACGVEDGGDGVVVLGAGGEAPVHGVGVGLHVVEEVLEVLDAVLLGEVRGD